MKAALGTTGYPVVGLMALVETGWPAGRRRHGGCHVARTPPPARQLTGLYHERWEHELAYLALRHNLWTSGASSASGRPTRSHLTSGDRVDRRDGLDDHDIAPV
jgi:hypothetical protein